MDISEDGIQRSSKERQFVCPTFSMLLFYFGIVIAALAIYLPIDMNYGFLHLIKEVDFSSPKGLNFYTYAFHKLGLKNLEHDKIFSKEELAKFVGNAGDELYLSILGRYLKTATKIKILHVSLILVGTFEFTLGERCQ